MRINLFLFLTVSLFIGPTESYSENGEKKRKGLGSIFGGGSSQHKTDEQKKEKLRNLGRKAVGIGVKTVVPENIIPVVEALVSLHQLNADKLRRQNAQQQAEAARKAQAEALAYEEQIKQKKHSEAQIKKQRQIAVNNVATIRKIAAEKRAAGASPASVATLEKPADEIDLIVSDWDQLADLHATSSGTQNRSNTNL